jgi:hypothetical protein
MNKESSRKNKIITKIKIPLWFLIINIIVFSSFLIGHIIYFLNNNSPTPWVLFFMGLILISSVFYIMSALYFIILSLKKRFENISILLVILGIASFILPILFLILNFPNTKINNLILNIFPFLTLILSIILLINQFIDNKKEYSNHLSITKFVTFMILTLGLYFVFWYYKNLEYIEDYGRKDINTTLRFLGLFVPILNIFLIYDEFIIIKEINQNKFIKVTWSPGWMTFWLIFLYGLERFLIYFTDENSLMRIILYIGIVFIICFPLIEVQDSLNDYWNIIQKKFPKRNSFSKGEIVFVVIAALIWILYIITLVFGNF